MLLQQYEWWLVYSLVVAGKSATFAERVMARLFSKQYTPFVYLRRWVTRGVLREKLEKARTGNYTKLEQALTFVTQKSMRGELDLTTCHVEDLEAIPGVGPKTARFFLLQTRPGIRVAALDVHILRWLRENGHTVPKQTPPKGPHYQAIEERFLAIADRLGVSPKDLDAKIWEGYRRVW